MDLAGIRHVAELAELSLTEEEEKRMATEVGRILAYVAELDAVDTEGVPPTAHLSGHVSGHEPARSGDGWRPDEPLPCLTHDEALAAAPRVEQGGFAVPGFVE